MPFDCGVIRAAVDVLYALVLAVLVYYDVVKYWNQNHKFLKESLN